MEEQIGTEQSGYPKAVDKIIPCHAGEWECKVYISHLFFWVFNAWHFAPQVPDEIDLFPSFEASEGGLLVGFLAAAKAIDSKGMMEISGWRAW